MSKVQNVIAVRLSYDKSILLPFDEQGLAIARFLEDAPLHSGDVVNHYGGDVTFQPYSGDPIEVTVVKMATDATQAYVEASQRASELQSQVWNLESKSKKAMEEKDAELARLRGEMDSVLSALRELEPVEDDVQRGDSPATKTRKRRGTIAQANDAIAKLRKLGGADDDS